MANTELSHVKYIVKIYFYSFSKKTKYLEKRGTHDFPFSVRPWGPPFTVERLSTTYRNTLYKQFENI